MRKLFKGWAGGSGGISPKWWPKLVLVGLLAGAPLLGGCAYFDMLISADKAIEPHTDKFIDRAEALRCRMPLDVVGRAANRRGDAWVTGWLGSCPEQRELMERLVTTPERR